MSAISIPVAIAVVLRGGDALIGRRGAGGALAGVWEFPGGKVEAGETPAAAAVRECFEETGLAVEIVGPLPQTVYAYDHGRVELHFFRCRPVDATVLPRSPFVWVACARLGEYEFPPANADVLRWLAEFHETAE